MVKSALQDMIRHSARRAYTAAMPAPRFQPRDVRLRDGREVHVREIRPTDEDELLQAFERLGPDDRYMRFMTATPHADVTKLRAVLASFGKEGFAITAAVPASDGIDLVGTASCIRTREPGEYEFAISIQPGWHGVGLGRVLMEGLVEHGRASGVKRIMGFMLAANQPMLGLARQVGFTVVPDPHDPAARIATLDLRAG